MGELRDPAGVRVLTPTGPGEEEGGMRTSHSCSGEGNRWMSKNPALTGGEAALSQQGGLEGWMQSLCVWLRMCVSKSHVC